LSIINKSHQKFGSLTLKWQKFQVVSENVAVETRRYLFVELSTAWQREEVEKKVMELQAGRKAKKDAEKRAKWEEERQDMAEEKRGVAQGEKCKRHYKGRGETCKE